MGATLLSLLRMVVVLGAIIGLLVALGRVAQRRQGGPVRSGAKKNGASIEVLSRKSLGQHVSLLVVRAGERTLLVGQSSQQMTLLTELDEAEWDSTTSEPLKKKTAQNLLAPRLAPGDDITASRAWDAFLYRLREMTVRR
ncbi:MAG TPA: flagellar biosynthetic protein FliO [Acidimicrobiales bacterium]